MPEAASEAELITLAVGGDQHALERLLFAHYDRLLRRIARKIPDRLCRASSEEDVLQDTLAAAFQAIPGFTPQGRFAFYRWLCTIADHQLINAIKRHDAAKRGGGWMPVNTRPASPNDSYDDLVDLLSSASRTPSRSAAGHEAAAAIHVGLASINEDYRQALKLRYVRGMAVADVAEAMDRSERAVHNLCHRGLKQLNAVMGRSSQYLTRK